MDPRGGGAAKAFGALQKVGFLARASTVALLFILLHASRRIGGHWSPPVSAMIHKQQVKVTNCFLQVSFTTTTNRNILPAQLHRTLVVYRFTHVGRNRCSR